MRVAIAGAALCLLLIAPRSSGASPSVRGASTIGLGMRGNQGDVTDGGFRLLMAAGVAVEGVDLVLELDRQIGPDARLADSDGDAGHWHEWVIAARSGHRAPLVKGLSLLLTAGVSLVRVTLTGALESSHPVEVNRSNLGLEVGAAFMWQSESLIVIVGTGATGVPFMQRMQAGRTEVEMRPHLEPTAVLGIGFLY